MRGGTLRFQAQYYVLCTFRLHAGNDEVKAALARRLMTVIAMLPHTSRRLLIRRL